MAKDRGRPLNPAEIEAAFHAGRIPSRVKRVFCGGDDTTRRKARPCIYCGRPHVHNNACCSAECFKAYCNGGRRPMPTEERIDWENVKRFFCRRCGANFDEPAYDEPVKDPSELRCPECDATRNEGGVELFHQMSNEEIRGLLEKKQNETKGDYND